MDANMGDMVRPESDEFSRDNAFLPDFARPPWPEWSDEEINNDTWDDVRYVQEGYFTDPLGTIIPPNIPIQDWVRPTDLFLEPMLLNPQESEMDLISPNFHLCEASNMIRCILSEISELYELALQRDFYCDGEGYDYIANSDHPWKPWDHIYSLNQAGVLGSRPRINPKGRYVVRLYFMGAWRRITVDDRIPLVKYGLFGLPVSQSLELWPTILTKAILKVALATCGFQADPEFKRFSTIACLTGWIHEWHQVPQPVTTDELWQYLHEVLPKYKRPRPQRKKLLRDFEFETDSLFLLKAPEGTKDGKEKLRDSGESKTGKGSKKDKKKKKKDKSDNEATTTDTEAESVKSKGKGKKGKKKVRISDSEQSDDDGQTTARTEKKGTDGEETETDSKKGKGKKKKKGKGKSDDESSSQKGKKSKKKKGDAEEKPVTSPKKGASRTVSAELRRMKDCPPGILPAVKTTPAGIIIPTCRAASLPSIEAICMGVKKHLGPLQHGAMVDLEKKIGRDVPFAVAACFMEFPRDDHGQPLKIPSHLHKHPVYLAQVRDCPIRSKDSCRPPTPLWKTFRWKKWAMKKGIIPKDETFDGREIRSILSKSPFTLNTKWVDMLGPGVSYDSEEEEEEMEEIMGETIHPHLVGPIEMPILFKIPPLAMYEDLPKIINTAQTPAPTALVPLPRLSKKGKKGSGSGSEQSGKAKKKGKKGKGDDGEKSKKSDDDGKKKKKEGKKEKKEKGEEKKPKEKKGKSKSGDKSESGGSDSGSKGGKGKKKKKGKGEENVKFGPEVVKPAELMPQKACGEIWIDVQDVGDKLASITKFYTTKNTHGCFYVLKRAPKPKIRPHGILKGDKDPASRWETPASGDNNGKERTATSSSSSSKPQNARHVSIDIAPWQMNNIDDLDAGFYLFSDCWTMQELLITLEVLNESYTTDYVTSFADNNESTQPAERRVRPATVILKPWDWRKECEIDGSVIVISTTTSCSIHIPLPPGRNLFRMWFLDEPSIAGEKCLNGSGDAFPYRRGADPYFSVKVLAQTPIAIGNREKIQNIMTGETALFIRQADILARSVWALLLSFGKCMSIQWKSLKQLRRSYCPTPSVRNPINDILRWTHDKFDSIFLSWVAGANGGKLHKWALLTARTLLLNPKLGFGEYDPADYPVDEKDLHMLEHRKFTQENGKLIKCHLLARHCVEVWECVARTMQRYWRGWLTRRLFHVRRQKHKSHERVDEEIRRIAFYLARAITPDFEPISDPEVYSKLRDAASLILTVPNWAVETLHQLLQSDPWLISVMPHAYSFPLHTTIQDVEGVVPSDDASQWVPFYRHYLHNSPTATTLDWRFYQFDLQTYPNEEMYMAVVDNETSFPVEMPHKHMYVGKLPVTEAGYTILLYKLRSRGRISYQEGRELSNVWKLRIISPERLDEEMSILRDERKGGDDLEPPALKLSRFTGFYIPNDDACICRYTLDVTDPSTTISVRFTTSFEDVDLKLQIWDLNTRRLILQRHGRGTLFLPSVVLQRENSDSLSTPGETSLFNMEEEEMLGENDENEENFTLTEPEAKRRAHHTQQYAIGIFVEGSSWPLTDKEWDFVQLETKKFWKKMLVFRAEAAEHDRMLALARAKKSVTTEPIDDLHPEEEPEEMDKSHSVVNNKKSAINKEDDKKKVTAKGTKRQIPATVPKSKSKKKKKRKSRRSVTAEKTDGQTDDGTKEDEIKALLTMSDLINVPLDSFDQIKSETDYGSYEDSGLESARTDDDNDHSRKSDARSSSGRRSSSAPGDGDDDDDNFPLVEKRTENLTILEGGQDSQYITDVAQPHWTLEIVTDNTQNVEFKSNRRAFQERLIATKLEWEKNQPGRYRNGRVARHEFLARNLIPIEAEDPNPFGVVAYTNKFYSCMYYDDDQLDGFNFTDWPEFQPKAEPEPAPQEFSKESFHPHPEEAVPSAEGDRHSTASTLTSSAKGTILKSPRKSITVTIEGNDKDADKAKHRRKQTIKSGRKSVRARGKSILKNPEPEESGETTEVPKTGEETEGATEEEILTTAITGDEETIVSTDFAAEYAGEMRPETSFLEELIPAQLQHNAVSKVPSALMEIERRYCAPPRRGPTHILMGPELEKCGILPKGQLIGIENQMLNDMYGLARKKVTVSSQRKETKRRYEAWLSEYMQTRVEFREELEGQFYHWFRFREDLHNDVFCELEANRYFLEQFREVYNQKFALKSPGRSSTDFMLKSMSEIRDILHKLSNATTMSSQTDRTSIATTTGTVDGSGEAISGRKKKDKKSAGGNSQSEGSSETKKKSKRSRSK